jgi:hypothetical protein
MAVRNWFIIVVLSIVGCASIRALAQSGGDYLYMRVLPGDTLVGLFGPSWQGVWHDNEVAVVRDGREVLSPDILIAGSILRVRRGTTLTALAASRLRDAGRHRASAARRLEQFRRALAGRDEAQAPLAELERLISSEERFVMDEELIDSTLKHLEATTQFVDRRQRTSWSLKAMVGVITAVVAAVVVLMFYRRTGRPDAGRDASRRFSASAQALERALHGR